MNADILGQTQEGKGNEGAVAGVGIFGERVMLDGQTGDPIRKPGKEGRHGDPVNLVDDRGRQAVMNKIGVRIVRRKTIIDCAQLMMDLAAEKAEKGRKSMADVYYQGAKEILKLADNLDRE